MDDGEVELSEHVLPVNSDSFLDDFLKNPQTCTHTHTCNPPGPDAAHTHTCFHTHARVFPFEEDYVPNEGPNQSPKRRMPVGNREAVRKYREKKKAHTAYLEEEVKKLKLMNQQLVRKLQGKAILEAEALRLRGLLMDLRGKIDSELGIFPLQKQCQTTSAFKEGNCGGQFSGGEMGIECENYLPCFHPNLSISGSGKMVAFLDKNCQPPVIDCQAATANDAASTEGCAMLVSSVSRA